LHQSSSRGGIQVSRAHVGEAIPLQDNKAIEDVACYVIRNPLSLKRLVYLDGQKAVLYRAKMNPTDLDAVSQRVAHSRASWSTDRLEVGFLRSRKL
jgi:hypothetical protein